MTGNLRLTKEKAASEFADFFLSEYESNPIGVSDWVMQGPWEFSDVLAWAKALSSPQATEARTEAEQ
jgi:hypothetical protein